jgi:tetratricopeptide (TPR) repeat protein
VSRTGAALLLLLAVAAPARAEDPLWTEAKRLKDIAAESYRRGEYETALDYLEQAKRLYPSANIEYDLGLALTKLDRDAEAADAFELYLARAKDVPEALRKSAAAQLDRIDAKLGRLTVECSVPGAAILVDGKARGATPLAAPLRLAPGAHTLRVARGGFQPSVQELSLDAGEARKVTVALEPVEPTAAPTVAPQPSAPLAVRASPLPPPRPLYRRGWFWGVLVSAAALVGGAIALGFLLAPSTQVRMLPDIVPQ